MFRKHLFTITISILFLVVGTKVLLGMPIGIPGGASITLQGFTAIIVGLINIIVAVVILIFILVGVSGK